MIRPVTATVTDLVQANRVHRRLYTDPAIFDLEMAGVFGRAWIYVGHESQIPAAGDVHAAHLGPAPVVLYRDRMGTIAVAYDPDGHAQGADTRRVGDAVGAVEGYRGFIFARRAETGASLAEVLGPIRSSLDDMVDRAPGGALGMMRPVHRHVLGANWKLVLENLNDLGHPAFVHASSIAAAAPPPTAARDFAADDIMAANGASVAELDRAGLRAFAHGHSYMGGLPVAHTVHGATRARYRALLVARHGEARTDAILAVNRHQSIIYPSLSVQSFFQLIKIIRPIAVDRTEVTSAAFRLEGAPDAYARMSQRFLDATNSPASPILTDDLAVLEACQRGLAAGGRDWLVLDAGLGEDVADASGGMAGRGLSELAVRNQLAAWRTYMAAHTWTDGEHAAMMAGASSSSGDTRA